VSPGIAIGPAHVLSSGELQVPDYQLAPEQVTAEQQRFADAVARARRQIRKLKSRAEQLPEGAAEEVGFLLEAHLAMLTNSRLTRGAEQRIAAGSNAEAAIQAEITVIAHSFAGMDDAYLAARIADVREVGSRLIRILLQRDGRQHALATLPPGCIVIAEELSPSEAAQLDPDNVAGIIAEQGGAEDHTAILARSLGLPTVLGVPDLLGTLEPGDLVIVDGTRGDVVVRPDEATAATYRARQAELGRARELLKGLKKLPAVTTDGINVLLQANIDLPRELDAVLESGASGIGLLRTEFLFMNRPDLPDEDEQFAMLSRVVGATGGRPVTARTLDVGGDKLVASLRGRFGESTNPALGLRAIRLSLREPRLLETQLAAMLRAGAIGPLRILLPMISSVSELVRVREILVATAKRLKRRGVKIAEPLPPLGVMIEVPGAALTADALAAEADFFSIGTNDLTQYTLAIDRGDEDVAHLYQPLHPAVLRLIQFATDAALRARLPVAVCGEIAGDPRYSALLLGLGVRELSMVPASIPLVKQRIRSLSLQAASRRAAAIMDQSDPARISALIDDFNRSEA